MQPTAPEIANKEAVAHKVSEYEDRLGILGAVADACARGRQYGDAFVWLGIMDGRDPSEPVDPVAAPIQTIKWAVVLDRRDFTVEDVGGPESKHFGQPLRFRVSNLDGVLQDGVRIHGTNSNNVSAQRVAEYFKTESGTLLIHRDRVLRFSTADALSMLDTIQDSLQAYLETADGVKRAARDHGTLLIGIKDWLGKSRHSNSAALSLARLREVIVGKASTNAIVHDKDSESVTTSTSNFSGLATATNSPMVWLSAALGIPNTIYWLVSPGGFGTGESEIKIWDKSVGSFQSKFIRKELTPWHGYVFACMDAGINLPADTPREITFGDLSPPDEEQRAKTRSDALSDLNAMKAQGGISAEEYRATAAKIAKDDPSFPLTLLEREKQTTANALVGAITASVEMVTAMSAGLIPIDVGELLLSSMIPENITPEIAAQIAAMLRAAGPAQPAPGLPGAPPLGAPSTAVEGDPAGEEDVEAAAAAAAWEQGKAPADALPAKEIGPLLNMSTIAVTNFAAANGIKKWRDLKDKLARYSLGAFQAAYMEHNDTHPPQSCALMIEIPEVICATFPEDAERGAPHVTLLYVGKIGAADRNKVRDVATRVLAESTIKEGAATLGALDYFDPPDDKRVAYAAVDFRPTLDALHRALRAAVEAEGIEVKHVTEDGYTPHATLAYLPAGEDYTGEVPTGSWSFAQVSLWWGDKREAIPLVAPAPVVES